jgi:pimeloyl-ACP methyl ester carboxylesterase
MLNLHATMLVLSFLITSCGSDGGESHIIVPDEDVTPFTKDYLIEGQNTGKRAFLIHGLGGHANTFNTSDKLRLLKDGMKDKGYQVVMFTLPDHEVYDLFSDGGERYRAAYTKFLRWIIADTASRHGRASVTFGGVSFGGLHAMMAAAINPNVDRYFCIKPVTDPAALTEFSAYTVDQFNPLLEIASLRQKRGYILYADDDTRVNGSLTEQLLEDLHDVGASVNFTISYGTGHTTTAEIVQETLNNI